MTAEVHCFACGAPIERDADGRWGHCRPVPPRPYHHAHKGITRDEYFAEPPPPPYRRFAGELLNEEYGIVSYLRVRYGPVPSWWDT